LAVIIILWQGIVLDGVCVWMNKYGTIPKATKIKTIKNKKL
jgi:hypothetical protein